MRKVIIHGYSTQCWQWLDPCIFLLVKVLHLCGLLHAKKHLNCSNIYWPPHHPNFAQLHLGNRCLRCRTGGHVGAEQVAPAAPQIELCSNWVRGSWSCMGTKALSPVFVWLSVWCLYWPCCTQIALVYSPTFWQACSMGDGHPGA